jgi:DNA-binding GntR family transcriptional regulator
VDTFDVRDSSVQKRTDNKKATMSAGETDETSKYQPGDGTAHAYREMREAILSGELAPGSVLSQVQIAAQLGISRTPLREAIRLLQTEGLVDSKARHRVRVAPVNLADLDVLYSMRILLEPLGVFGTIPKLTDADFAEIEAAFDKMQVAVAERSLVGIKKPHRDFHFGFFRYAGERLHRSLSELWDHAERYRLLYTSGVEDQLAMAMLASSEHEAILDAARARDAEKCSQLVARHLSRTALTVFANEDQRHDASSVRHALELVDGDR